MRQAMNSDDAHCEVDRDARLDVSEVSFNVSPGSPFWPHLRESRPCRSHVARLSGRVAFVPSVLAGPSTLVFDVQVRGFSDFLGRLQPSKTTIQKTLDTLGVEESK